MRDISTLVEFPEIFTWKNADFTVAVFGLISSIILYAYSDKKLNSGVVHRKGPFKMNIRE